MSARRAAALVLAACGAALSGCSTWNPLIAMGIMSEDPRAHAARPGHRERAAQAIWIAQVGKADGFGFRRSSRTGASTPPRARPVSVVEEETERSRRIDAKRLSSGVEVGEGRVIVGTPQGRGRRVDLQGKEGGRPGRRRGDRARFGIAQVAVARTLTAGSSGCPPKTASGAGASPMPAPCCAAGGREGDRRRRDRRLRTADDRPRHRGRQPHLG